MSLPVLHLSGTPYQQGLQHGQVLRERIEHNLALYLERFQREGRLARPELLRRAASYLAALQGQSAEYFENLRGVAQGSGCDLVQLAALNVRYELLYYQFGRIALADGCTALALTPELTANKHLLLAQNWDWIPEVQGALLHTCEPGGLETLSFSEAGIVGGKIGLNSEGLGLTINGLTSSADDWSRLSRPFHLRCYEILRSPHLEAALQVVTAGQRSCSANFLIAQVPDQMADIESAPELTRRLGCEHGALVHTNHFFVPDLLGIIEPPNDKLPYSIERLSRMRKLLAAQRPISPAEIKNHLCDHQGHPYSICRHLDLAKPPEERYATIVSVMMDLQTRTLQVSDGPPCQSEYQQVSLVR